MNSSISQLRRDLQALARPIGPALLLCVLAMPSDAAAQPGRPTSPVRGDTIAVTLEDAVMRAARESQEVRLARAQVDLAEAQVRAARASALPQIDGNLAYTRTFESPFSVGAEIPDSLRFEPDTLASLEERVRYLERRAPTAGLGGLGALFGDLPFGRENAYTFAFTGSQPVYSGGRLGAAQRIAREFLEAARLGLREQMSEIELQVRTAYFRARLAGEIESIAQAAVNQAEQFYAQEQLRLRAGSASDLEVLRAEVVLENLRPQLVQARNAAELATLDLKRLIDVPLTQPVRLATPLDLPTTEQLAAAAIDAPLILTERSAVRAAERQVAIREQQVRIARAAYLPSVGLRVNYGRQLFPTDPFAISGQDWRTDFSATIAAQIPVFSGFRRQAEVAQARVQLEQERLRLAQLRESVQLQYQQALGERQRAAASIAARRRTVDQAQRVHDLTVLRYERGLATQLEVSDARVALLQARTNLAQAVADFFVAQAGVSRALGETTTSDDSFLERPASPQGARPPVR